MGELSCLKERATVWATRADVYKRARVTNLTIKSTLKININSSVIEYLNVESNKFALKEQKWQKNIKIMQKYFCIGHYKAQL